MARGAAVHGDDADSDDEDDEVYAGMHSGVLLEGFEHLDVDEIMVCCRVCISCTDARRDITTWVVPCEQRSL